MSIRSIFILPAFFAAFGFASCQWVAALEKKDLPGVDALTDAVTDDVLG